MCMKLHGVNFMVSKWLQRYNSEIIKLLRNHFPNSTIIEIFCAFPKPFLSSSPNVYLTFSTIHLALILVFDHHSDCEISAQQFGLSARTNLAKDWPTELGNYACTSEKNMIKSQPTYGSRTMTFCGYRVFTPTARAQIWLT